MIEPEYIEVHELGSAEPIIVDVTPRSPWWWDASEQIWRELGWLNPYKLRVEE